MKNNDNDKTIAFFTSEFMDKMHVLELAERLNPEIVQKQLAKIEAEIMAGEKSGMPAGKLARLKREAAQLGNILKTKSEEVVSEETLDESKKTPTKQLRITNHRPRHLKHKATSGHRHSRVRSGRTPLMNMIAAGVQAYRHHKAEKAEKNDPRRHEIDLYHHAGENRYYGHIHGHNIPALKETDLRAHLINDHGYHPQHAEDIIQHTKKHKRLKSSGSEKKEPTRKQKMIHHLHQALVHNKAFETSKEHATVKVNGELKNKRLHHKEQRDLHAAEARRHGFKMEKHGHLVMKWHRDRQTPKEHEEEVRAKDEASVHAKSSTERWEERNKSHGHSESEPKKSHGSAGHTPTRWAKHHDPKNPWKHVRRYDPDSKHARDGKKD